MRLMAAFGPKLIVVTEKTLVDRGILAKPFFKFANVVPHPKLRKTSPWQRAYQLGVVECPDRNATIIRNVKSAAEVGAPALVLVQHKRHGELLEAEFKKLGLRTEFIRGENDQKERKRALAKLASGAIDVLIGTTILDVGVDVPVIGLVVLAGAGKAEVALRQRIGRGLRAKKAPAANVCFVLDFDDNLNTYLRDHARQRRAIIEATEGFAENIQSPEKDFDWSMMKVARAA